MSFTWSSTFTIGQSNDITKGDKIILPQAALESIIKAYVSAPVSPNVQPVLGPESFSRAQSQYDSFDQSRSRQQELPSPLIFQIRNPANRFLIHGGVREFSADDGQVYLPEWMMTSLALNPGDQVMIKYASLPKGIWAKFRPVTADYLEILDFRALFEAQLRANYTALTRGEVLKVYQGNKEFEFIIEELKPAPGDAVCIIDTDLEVNIEPLEMKADEETILSAGRMSNGVRPKDPESGNSGHVLKIGSERQGRVPQGEYERWAIDIPNRKSSVEIVVHVQEPGDLDVVISTKLPVSLQDHIWANFESTSSRIIIIPASDQDYAGQQDSQTIHVAVYGRKSSITTTSISSFPVSTVPDLTGITLYSIQINYYNDVNSSSTIPSGNIPNKDVPGFHECTNCGSWIPERTKELHNNFCHRNNAKCDSCNLVMKKEDFLNHFHCDHCDKYGDISEKKKHMEIYHGWYQCSCGSFESSALPELAIHRREACPEKLIICRYCHTLVQQGGLTSNMRDRIRGLHSHESYCGDRTIQCQKCLQMVSLKDIQVHAQNHEYQRQNQATPQLCSNQNCARLRGSTSNVLGLCQICFGPYWIPTEDPKYQKLVSRLAKKYHTQLMNGCGKSWCRNQYCATYRGRFMDATNAATEMISILRDARVGASEGHKTWLCVDEGSTRKKVMAEVLLEEVGEQYTIEWCVKALEAERTDLAAAAHWLQLQAPKVKKSESV